MNDNELGETMPEKITRLINRKTGELQCKICGTTFYASVRPLVGSDYYSCEYRCPNGCVRETP